MSSTNGLKTELLNYGTGEWEERPDYPFPSGERIAYYATASTIDSVLIIGGYDNYYGQSDGPSYTSTIAEYKDGSWKNIGNLAQARHGHGAITLGSMTMVVGGNPNSEESGRSYGISALWKANSSNKHYHTITEYGIGLFLVDEKYCSKSEKSEILQKS